MTEWEYNRTDPGVPQPVRSRGDGRVTLALVLSALALLAACVSLVLQLRPEPEPAVPPEEPAEEVPGRPLVSPTGPVPRPSPRL